MNYHSGRDYGRAANKANASPARQLRIHQPHDMPAPVHGGVAAERNELAGVVGKIACRLRQHAASATMHCGMLARRLAEDPHNLTILNEVVEAVRALESLVDGLADYAADQPPQFEQVAVSRLVREILDSMKERVKRQQVSVEVSIPVNLTADCDRRMFGTAVRNLVSHALCAMPKGGQLVVTGVATPQGIELEVGDSGPGLSEHDLPAAFLPLRSAQPGASGLELAIAAQMAAAHGGDATVCNCPEGGAALTLVIPHRQAQSAAAAA